MTSRLDRLFVLLETGSSAVTRRAAAQQLGEAQRLHPHELHHLLARVSTLLKSPQWDTRVAAAHAVQAILAQVPQWDPQPLNLDTTQAQLQQDGTKDGQIRQSNKPNRLSLRDFDMARVLARSSHLTGSEGSEYDLVVAETSDQPNPQQTEKIFATKLGLHPQLMGIDTNELFTTEDLAPSMQAPGTPQTKMPIDETMCQPGGLSRREMNRARLTSQSSIPVADCSNFGGIDLSTDKPGYLPPAPFYSETNVNKEAAGQVKTYFNLEPVPRQAKPRIIDSIAVIVPIPISTPDTFKMKNKKTVGCSSKRSVDFNNSPSDITIHSFNSAISNLTKVFKEEISLLRTELADFKHQIQNEIVPKLPCKPKFIPAKCTTDVDNFETISNLDYLQVARQSISKQRSREPDDPQDHQTSLTSGSGEPLSKKPKQDESTMSEASWSGEEGGSWGVPDGTGCWPETAVEWPLESFAESLCQDLFSQKWEVRHGAATALRELVRLHGKGAGKSRDQTKEEMDESHRRWVEDAALRLLCVLGLDRFGDFVSDQVVAPVRETCAQALGSLLLLMPCTDSSKNNGNCDKQTKVEVKIEEAEDKIKEGGALGVLAVVLKLLQHNEWEARHGALLALKYLLAVRDDLLDELLPRAFPAAMCGLADAVDDVGAAAASALIPVAGTLPKLLTPAQLETVVQRLWELLREQDDLAAACNSFMGLLAAILSLPAARAHLTPQPLSQVLPRLWPFLGHSSSSVRKATLQTLLTLTGDEGNPKDEQGRWGDAGGVVLHEALRQVFQRALVEHVAGIQEVAEKVWHNLVVRSDLELLLHASCPLVSTWLCLAMQPEHVPFSASLLVTATTTQHNSRVTKTCGGNSSDAQSDSGSGSGGSKSSSELKVYIGGVETVAPGTRRANVVRARCMAARMLGLLSCYVVRPAPGVVYTADIPSPALCYAKVLLVHLASRSALQRTVVGLTMAHWATLEHPNPPSIPDILRDKLLGCLSECVYYDEIAVTFTRLLQEARDYVATLKHYKLPLNEGTGLDVAGVSGGVMTLEQITALTGKTIAGLVSIGAGTGSGNAVVKLKPKVLESLEERRRTIETGATATAMQQHALNVTSMAALAGAATMLRCLPAADCPLNPLVKPLMESVKREENDQLQSLAARHLAHLVDLCVDRQPSPNHKIATNLCTFLCTDTEFTPRIVSDAQPFDGILTLTNRQRHAERVAYNRGGFGGNGGRGPGRPPTTEIPLEELLAYEEPEAKAARTRRRGATLALSAVTKLLGAQLPSRLPRLWDLMLPPVLRDCIDGEYFYQQDRQDEATKLVSSLQVLETVVPSLDPSLLPPAVGCAPRLCNLLAHPYKAVRHMAARCLAILATLRTEEVMQHVVRSVIPLLEPSSGKESSSRDKIQIIAPAEVDAKRQGAAEALTCLVESLGVGVVPYAVLLVVPLLGRMSDQNQAVRLTCSATFATLVQLMPLDPGAIGDPPLLGEEKAQERHFLEQLLNPRSIPDTKLPVSVSAELRAYQHQGLNWLAFLNRYRLHGVLCDDMGLGKTLQTLCMLATDHYHHPHASPSLVVCPPTLTGHWVYEAEKFFKSQDLSALQYAGPPPEREKLRPRVSRYRLVVASYDIVRKDIEFFEAIQWNYCVLDEGHVIKNGKTKSAKAAKRLRAYHRLILSGTPVQNDVLELWSLFDFLMPGFLGSEKQFAARYSRPILASREPKAGAKDQEAGALAMEALHRQVLPFLLRRNKEDVLQDLPPKITQDYYCDLSPLQRTLYEDFRTRHSASLAGSVPANNPSGTHVFQALRYLRNVCNHPKLVLTPRHPQYMSVCASLKHQQSSLTDIEHGAKLPALKQLLLDCGIGQQQQHSASISSITATESQQQHLVSQHRALIFCQLKAMLDIVERDLLRVHLPTVTYLRLDGSVPASQRHAVVARFNADPSIDVLLLTTQVGGLGLNLTGADTVIFVEHDWNPMKDLQAMDRAHRIGQKKVVNVYRLITRATLEEKIMGLQKFKLLTANTVISTENASMETMGTDQLLDLFSLDNNKDKRADGQGSSGATDGQDSGFTGIAGVSRSVLESLPELWEQQQYDDEYDLDSFLSTLRGENQPSSAV